MDIKLKLSASSGPCNNTKLKGWNPSWEGLKKSLSNPIIGPKDGPYFIRCPGTVRNNSETASTAAVLILDGDSRINNDTGEILAGAPDPELIHQVLSGLGLTHLIYSSFSNAALGAELALKTIDSGGLSGSDYHKYRVIIPCCYGPEQLPPLLDYLFAELHQAGVMLAPVKENRTWCQPWFFPRVPDQNRLECFKFFSFDGALLDVDQVHQAWLLKNPPPQTPQIETTPQRTARKTTQNQQKPIAAFNRDNSVADVLKQNGYVKKGERFLRPNSSSNIPGVVLLTCADSVIRAFSHGNDALNDAKAHDSFDVFCLLEHGGDQAKALAALRPETAISKAGAPNGPESPPLSAYEADLAGLPDTTPRKPRTKKATSHVGNPAESMLKILKRYIFLKNHNRIYDTLTRNELSREGFDGALCHLFPENKISMLFLNDPECIKVDGLIYLPGDKNNPVSRNGSILWNIWADPGVKLPDLATNDDIEPWLDHLDYLYPDSAEQQHLLNWMACILQKPQIKINHALLISGTSRSGKDMMLNPLRFGLGAANVCEPPAGELKESFTDYLHHSKLVIFQEIQTFEGLDLENKLKPMLAAPPDMLRVRLFGRGFYETPNLIQAIFMSNYRDALHISAGDGRYFAIWTDSQPLDSKYYTDLAAWQDDGGNGLVVRWLLNRDISQFNPKQPAPSSTFKDKLLETSKSPLKHLLSEMIEALDYPFNVDCVRSIDIAKRLRDKYSSKAIGSVLAEIGCYQKFCRKSDGDRKRLSLFAVRHIGEKSEKNTPIVKAGDLVLNWSDEQNFTDKVWLSEYVKGDPNRRNDWGDINEINGQTWQDGYENKENEWD